MEVVGVGVGVEVVAGGVGGMEGRMEEEVEVEDAGRKGIVRGSGATKTPRS